MTSQGHWEECNPVWCVVTLPQRRVSSPPPSPAIRLQCEHQTLFSGGGAGAGRVGEGTGRGRHSAKREGAKPQGGPWQEAGSLLSEGLKGPRTASRARTPRPQCGT